MEISDAESEFNPENEEEPDDEDFKIVEEKPSLSRKTKDIKDSVVHMFTEIDEIPPEPDKPTDNITDLPIFTTDDDKAAFEQSLNVDLSTLNIDHMYRQHQIAQDLNEKALIASRLVTNNLSLYSCNVCEKIFKTLSHMRLHCLIHTDLKPFRCPRCPYASNAKGMWPMFCEIQSINFLQISKCLYIFCFANWFQIPF